MSKKDERKIADKLQAIVEALRRGEDVSGVAEEVGLDSKRIEALVDAIRTDLEVHMMAKDKDASFGGGRIIAYSDGASRGNPGPASCAVILADSRGQEYLRRSMRLGVATNNVAEYKGVILALELASTLGAEDVLLRLDSELVVKQLQGSYKVKHPSLKPLHAQALSLAASIEHFEVEHVPRAEMHAADKLANDALDGKD